MSYRSFWVRCYPAIPPRGETRPEIVKAMYEHLVEIALKAGCKPQLETLRPMLDCGWTVGALLTASEVEPGDGAHRDLGGSVAAPGGDRGRELEPSDPESSEG